MLKLFNFSLLAFLAFPLAVSAQGINFAASSSNAPIEVSAADGIELHQKEKKIIANKDAIAKRGESYLYADKIEAYYRQALEDNNTEIWKLSAVGNVKMTSDKSTAKGDMANYNIDTDILTLTGEPAHFISEGDHVTAASLEYMPKKHLVVASGDAKISREDNTLTATTISALFKENADGNLEVELMNADGKVVISTKTETATGDKASYNPKTGVAVLLGNVKLTKGDNYMTGEKATVNLKTGISKLFAGSPSQGSDGRVRGVFLPKSIKDAKTK